MNMKKIGLFALAGILSVSLLAGCGSGKNTGSSEKKKTFTIAYAPNESTEQSNDARHGLAKDLGKELNRDVKEIQASDYNAIIEALRTGKADMAYLGPLSVAMAHERADAEPIVMKAPEGKRSLASLDPSSARTIMEILKEMTQKRNIACLVNLHQVDMAIRYSSRIIGLSRGKMVFDGSPDQLTDAVIERIYGMTGEDLATGGNNEDAFRENYAS